MYQEEFISYIKCLRKDIQREIQKRSLDFEKKWINGSQKSIFAELVFCILTPQSKAEACWKALSELVKHNLLFVGNAGQIEKILQGRGPRFHRNKARYIVDARKLFSKNGKVFVKKRIKESNDIFLLRKWLVTNVKGLGYKEASHFLRNIYIGRELAVLDRHILKNLKALKVIKQVPKNLSEKKYIAIEEKMREFSRYCRIPMFDLDFILWYKQTGKVFK